MKRAMSIVLMAAFAAGCSRQGGPCDPEQVEAYFSLPAEAALPAVGRICKYPPGLQAMLDDLERVAPDMRAMIVAKGISENIFLFKRVCPKASDVFETLAALPPENKTTFLIEGCGLQGLGLARRDEMVGADMVNLLVAVMLYGWMKDEEVPRAREICRFALGLRR